jgi:hypothetical protein
MERLFYYLSKSKKLTHLTAMMASAIALISMFAWDGATPFKLGLALSIWCFFDGLLIAFATSYSNPEEGVFKGADAVMGALMAITAIIVLAGAILYSSMTQ